MNKKFKNIITFKNLRYYIKAAKHNNICIPKNKINKILLKIQGNNNSIIIDDIVGEEAFISINIFGNNNKIQIKKGFQLNGNLKIIIGLNHKNFGECNNSDLLIDENTSIGNGKYITYNSNAYCKIGKDCMFSSDINLYNTDAHPIMDKDTGKIINKVKGITIGNHCWLGVNTVVLKNSLIPDNSIVGINSVYTSSSYNQNKSDFLSTGGGNFIFAGNPAKIVKKNINWDSNGAKYGYIDNKDS